MSMATSLAQACAAVRPTVTYKAVNEPLRVRAPHTPGPDAQDAVQWPDISPAGVKRAVVAPKRLPEPPLRVTTRPPYTSASASASPCGSLLPPLPPAKASAAPHQTDTAHTHELAARLALLLHARECCLARRGCQVASCGVARGVLDHCQECFEPAGGCHVSCAQAKHLLRHFRVCRAHGFPSSCQLCRVLHVEFPWALEHAESLAPLPLRPQQPQPQHWHWQRPLPTQQTLESSTADRTAGAKRQRAE